MKIQTFSLCLGIVFLTTLRSFGAFDAFLKLGDGTVIRGESVDFKHKDEIDVDSFTAGVSAAGATGKPTFEPLTITKKVDKSSPVLGQICAQGTHIAKAVLTLRKAGKDALEYYIVTLTDVVVASISQNGTAGPIAVPTPTETVTFTFGTIHWKYTPQLPDGMGDSPVEGGWDLAASTPK